MFLAVSSPSSPTFLFGQTVEKWSLRDIKSQFHPGGGGASCLLHPPPVPARRNAAPQLPRDPTSQYAQQDIEGSQESQSAPTSPVDNAISNPLSDMQARTPSPTSRPKSMMVGMEEGRGVKYTTISFGDGAASASHPPPARRNTKYTNVVHEPLPERKTNKDGASAGAEPEQEEEMISPSYVGMQGVRQSQPLPPDVSKDNPTYDTPPPPVPLRLESQDVSTVSGGKATEAPISEPSNAGKGLFSDDPFGDGNANAWGDIDPTAFYDRPSPDVRVRPDAPKEEGGEEEEEEDGYFEIGKVLTAPAVCTADFTGDSTYEDTCSFLQDIRSRYKDRDPGEVLGQTSHGTRNNNAPSLPDAVEDEDDDEAAYDVPPKEVDNEVSEGRNMQQRKHNEEEDDEEGQGDSYDFPSELSRYPSKNESVHAQGSRDLQPQGRTSGGSKLDGADHHAPRHTIPLPPTPDDHVVGGAVPREGAPPLPARPLGAAVPVPPPGGVVSGKSMLTRDQPLPLLPTVIDRPPLPPMNHPWGNKRTTATSSSNAQPPSYGGDFPPLPPRKKNPNGHSAAEGGAPPPSLYHQPSSQEAHDDPPGLLDLLNRGYQRADIERALRIARNDYDMAKSILQEFGARH